MELNLRAAGHFFFGEIREQEKVTSGKIRGVGRVRQSFSVPVLEIHLRKLALVSRCIIIIIVMKKFDTPHVSIVFGLTLL